MVYGQLVSWLAVYVTCLKVTTGSQYYDNVRKLDAYDYVIVGAGSSGSVIANRLSEDPKVTVLLLEAGGIPTPLTEIPYFTPYIQTLQPETDWQYYTEKQKNACLGLKDQKSYWPRYKGLGGCSSHNYMVYTRGNHKDFDNWAEDGAVGWSYKDVLPFFKKSEDVTIPEYMNDEYHGTNGYLTVSHERYERKVLDSFLQAGKELGFDIVDYNGATQNGFSEMQFTQREGKRCSTEKAFLRPTVGRKNLDILLYAHATKIVFDDYKRARFVNYDYNNTAMKVEAKKEIILSAGAINSPQLLLLSGVGPAEHLKQFNIPVIADLPVGYNLQDHYIAGGLIWQINETVGLTQEKAFSPLSIADFVDGRGVLTSGGGMEGMAFMSTKYQIDTQFPDIQIQIGSNVLLADLPEYANKHVTSILPILTRPDTRGVLKLRSADPYERPILDYQYFSDSGDGDLKRMIEGMKFCYSIINTAAFQKYNPKPVYDVVPGCENLDKQSDEYLGCWARQFTYTDYHYSGTVKMGDPKNATTVVGPDLRVKGVSGLRVADASIMPVIVSANTNAATIMIAEKAADMIKSAA